MKFALAFFSEGLDEFVGACNSAASPETCAVTRLGSAPDGLHLLAVNVGEGGGPYTLFVSSTPALTASASASLVAAPQAPGDETVAPGYLAVETAAPDASDVEAQIAFDMRLGEFLVP